MIFVLWICYWSVDKLFERQYEGNHDFFSSVHWFEGHLPRGNVVKENQESMIDPMDIWPTWHHRYPKVDLEGRLFWDLHPLFSKTSSTSHGSDYNFVGVADVSGSLTLDDARPGVVIYVLFEHLWRLFFGRVTVLPLREFDDRLPLFFRVGEFLSETTDDTDYHIEVLGR